jgi:catalase
MAITNPTGRANYEPNSLGGVAGGPRETPDIGFTSVPVHEAGDKLRIRSESFADHYSQARQFYASQTTLEQEHIAAAFTFELSKVENPAIRHRMVANLRNVDEELAQTVGDRLGLNPIPPASKPGKTPVTGLAPSKALSIMQNGPTSFKGRKIGVLISDGVNRQLLDALAKALEAEEAVLEIIAPKVEGTKDSAGTPVIAQQKLGGGPSVLYDAVVVLVSTEASAKMLAKNPAARDFVTDAFAHLKFIGYSDASKPLLEKAGVLSDLDGGCLLITKASEMKEFVSQCRSLRFWERVNMMNA